MAVPGPQAARSAIVTPDAAPLTQKRKSRFTGAGPRAALYSPWRRPLSTRAISYIPTAFGSPWPCITGNVGMWLVVERSPIGRRSPPLPPGPVFGSACPRSLSGNLPRRGISV